MKRAKSYPLSGESSTKEAEMSELLRERHTWTTYANPYKVKDDKGVKCLQTPRFCGLLFLTPRSLCGYKRGGLSGESSTSTRAKVAPRLSPVTPQGVAS